MAMRQKIILSVCLFGLTLQCMAQIIPNQGFENWTNFGGWYDNPDYWKTNNSQIFTPVIKDINSHQGAFAIQINQSGYAKSRFAFSQVLNSIQCFAKSSIINGDSVHIKVLTYFYGNVVDSGIWINKTSVTNWSQQNISLNNSIGPIDSLEIQISGGHQIGSSLSVDDISFITAGLNEYNILIDWELFPIPTNNQTTLKFNNIAWENCTLNVFDIRGQIVKTIDNIITNQVIIEKTSLPGGLYFFQLQNASRIIAKGKLIFE